MAKTERSMNLNLPEGRALVALYASIFALNQGHEANAALKRARGHDAAVPKTSTDRQPQLTDSTAQQIVTPVSRMPVNPPLPTVFPIARYPYIFYAARDPIYVNSGLG